MGRVHSMPLKDSDASKKSTKKAPQPQEVFLTEEALEEQQLKDRQERPAFYTWTDGQGQLRSEFIPEGSNETTAADDDLDVTDYTLLASFRMPEREQIACCDEFKSRFKQQLEPLKSLVLRRPQQAELMPTKAGLKPAWYVIAPTKSSNLTAEDFPVLSLKVRDTSAPLSMIVLDQNYQPLHYLADMRSQLQPETWRSVAYYESLISIADNSAYAFIFYFAESVTNTSTIEVKWLP